MMKSIAKRVLTGLLLLWLISVISFWLSKLTPGDDVMDYLSVDDPKYSINSNPADVRASYRLIAHRRGLDLPSFYFSLRPGYMPDGVNNILPLDDRKTVKAWIHQSGDTHVPMLLYQAIDDGIQKACLTGKNNAANELLCQGFNRGLLTQDIDVFKTNLISIKDSLNTQANSNEEAIQTVSQILGMVDDLISDSEQKSSNRFLPHFHWNGTANQYHQWITGLLLQRPLTSLVDGLNAWTKIFDALKWTLLLNGLAFLLAIILGIGIGIWSGSHDGHPLERFLNWILFALFALPSFWLGTLFIYAFTSGEWLSIFPSGGLGAYQNTGSVLGKWSVLFSHLFLPVTCLTLGALAYVSRQMKQSILYQYQQPFVRALRIQGISERTILRRHVIKNALFPIITILGGSLPALLSGSLIIEVIYSIPGMGRLMYSSLMAHDWPVVFPLLMFGATITVFSYLLTDIVYKWIDPRVKIV